MLNNISWASYLYAISIILVIYYAVILIIYYRNEAQNYFAKIKGRLDHASARGLVSTEKEDDFIEHNSERYLEEDALRELSLDIQSLIKTGASRNFPKEELLLSLQLQLRKYACVENANLKNNVSNFIIASCEQYCSILLNVEEVSALWID